MKKICAWCGAVLDPGDENNPDTLVSHGICKDCRDEYFPMVDSGNGGDHGN